MGGQVVLATYEQNQSSKPADFEGSNISTESQIDNIDPIALFLENHGYKLVVGHEGQLVTAAEAVEGCPPFRVLVLAMGEAALALAAPKLSEGQEPEVEEKDSNEPTAEKISPQPQKGQTKPEAKTIDSAKDNSEATQQNAIEVDWQAADKSFTEAIVSEPKPATKQSPERPPKMETNASDPYAQEAVAPMQPEATAVEQRQDQLSTLTGLPEMVMAQPLEQSSQIIKPDQPNHPDGDLLSSWVSLDHPADTTETKPAVIEELLDYEELELAQVKTSIPSGVSHRDNESLVTVDLPSEKKYMIGSLITDSEIYEDAEDFSTPNQQEHRPLFVLEKGQYEHLSVDASLPVKQLQATIDRLSEKIDALEPEDKATQQILNKIAELPRKLETPEEPVDNQKDEIREELGELFTELLERMEIEYTPELIDAFVEFAIAPHPKPPLQVKLDSNDAEGIPQDNGMHESITKLLAYLNNAKRTLLHTYLIGRSAVHLYKLNGVL